MKLLSTWVVAWLERLRRLSVLPTTVSEWLHHVHASMWSKTPTGDKGVLWWELSKKILWNLRTFIGIWFPTRWLTLVLIECPLPQHSIFTNGHVRQAQVMVSVAPISLAVYAPWARRKSGKPTHGNYVLHFMTQRLCSAIRIDSVLYVGLLAWKLELVETLWDWNSSTGGNGRYPSLAAAPQ